MKINKDLMKIIGVVVVIALVLFIIVPMQNQEISEKGIATGQLSVIQYQMETANIVVIENNSIMAYPISVFCGGNETS